MTDYNEGTTIENFVFTKYLGNSKWELTCQNCGSTRVMGVGDINRYLKLNRKFFCKCDEIKKAYENLSGKIFGKLLVLDMLPIKKGKNKSLYWKCICSCGNPSIIEIKGNHLKSGNIQSCGCLIRERNKNQYILSEEYGTGYTLANEEFYFDLKDYNLIAGYSWWKSKNGYIMSRDKNIDGYSNKKIAMHRLLMEPNVGEEVDHINGIRWDNRRNNLRCTTHSLNELNRHSSKNNTSGRIGVSKCDEKWVARIEVGNIKYNLGKFENIEDAISARENKEKELLGDWVYGGRV